jgi:hypothetical protein
MVGACTTYGERRGVCSVWVGKPEGKRPCGGPRLRWEDLVVSLYTCQLISHLLHVINQGAGKFILTTHKNLFKAAATSAAR